MVNGSLKKLDNITKKGDTYSIETKHTNGIKIMKTLINGKEFKVEQKGNRFYYFSSAACRRLPIAKSKVIFS